MTVKFSGIFFKKIISWLIKKIYFILKIKKFKKLKLLNKRLLSEFFKHKGKYMFIRMTVKSNFVILVYISIN